MKFYIVNNWAGVSLRWWVLTPFEIGFSNGEFSTNFHVTLLGFGFYIQKDK
jgi:hypothetical protein